MDKNTAATIKAFAPKAHPSEKWSKKQLRNPYQRGTLKWCAFLI
jgi:hypothetical protein